MAIEINYDFEDSNEGPEKEKEVRTNFRITRCCANCKFYVTKRQDSNRGYCMYPNPAQKRLAKIKGESWSKEDFKSWSRAYATMLCDLYQSKYKAYHFRQIGEWIEREINIDGTVKEK